MNQPELSEITNWDPEFTKRVMRFLRPLAKVYHRSEVRGISDFPAGGAMVVSNHSGGMFPIDVPLFAAAFYDRFGYDRPVFTLSHDLLMSLPTDYMTRTGFHPGQSRECRAGPGLGRSGGGVPRW